MNDLVIIKEGKVVTTSRIIADTFGRLHNNVLRDIQALECSENFRELNFELSSYKVSGQRRPYPLYHMTRDGFAFLVMGFTGNRAAEFKEAFIREFNRMEQHIQGQQRPQQMTTPQMTDAEIMARALQITQRTIEDQKKQIEEMLPKAEAYDRFLDGEGLFNIRTTAKMLGVGPNKFAMALRYKGHFFQDRNIPKQALIDAGYCRVRAFCNPHSGYSGKQAFFTPQGAEWVRKLITTGKLIVR